MRSLKTFHINILGEKTRLLVAAIRLNDGSVRLAVSLKIGQPVARRVANKFLAKLVRRVMRPRHQFVVMIAMYLMVITTFMVPANAAPRTTSAIGGVVNFNVNGEYNPRSRCRDEAKRIWKRCRKKDRRPNSVCDFELERRRSECDRLRG